MKKLLHFFNGGSETAAPISNAVNAILELIRDITVIYNRVATTSLE